MNQNETDVRKLVINDAAWVVKTEPEFEPSHFLVKMTSNLSSWHLSFSMVTLCHRSLFWPLAPGNHWSVFSDYSFLEFHIYRIVIHSLLFWLHLLLFLKLRGHHQMVNTEIRLIIFSAAKDGEALYSQQKQDRELTVAQIMNSLLPNSDLNWRK